MLSTVLIIDKRKELSVKYKKTVDEADVNAIIARTLKDAIVQVQLLEPDLIIVSDSIEEELSVFCQKIRALTYNTRPVIVALSKSAEASDRISVLESGADDFLSEPVNIDEFKSRIKAHIRRDLESNLDTMTLLPNEKYVRKTLKRVLSSENQAVLSISINNLKDYKTVYTELAADKLIQTFIAIAKSALAEEDFIGQLSESEFVIVTNKYGAEKLAEFLTFAFDTVAPKFYSETDAKRGYMTLKGDRYTGMRVEFVSVLIGVLLDFSNISSVDILQDKLRSLTKMAKIPSGSNFMIERAKLTASDSVVQEFWNKNICIKECDESLRYLIRTALELQGYDVQEELGSKNFSQPAIVIYDCGEEFASLEALRKLKNNQEFVNTKFIVTTSIHDKITVLDYGADLYLPKPYEISDLIMWVEYFLKK
ncbi:MAG: diguanylate cyclase [Cyanobacteria bacterium SIG31]|nr:diguanylate cyclase [Cyanobacteria bacterium SIG31]